MNQKVYDLIAAYEAEDEFEKQDQEVMLQFIRDHEDVLTRNNSVAHFTVSAWITNLEHTKILMIYHNIYDSWAWVGGHADGEDDFLHVALKETEEETGLSKVHPLSDSICGIHIVTVEQHKKKGKPVSSHLHFDVEYLLEADERDAIRMKEDENQGVQWVPIEEVCHYTKEEKMKPIYQKLNEKLKRF